MDRIDYLLDNPLEVSSNDLNWINEKIEQYPYSSTFRLFRLIALKKSDPDQFERELPKVSYYFNNPEFISRYFTDLPLEIKEEIQITEIPVSTTQEEVKPGSLDINSTVAPDDSPKAEESTVNLDVDESELIRNLKKLGLDHLIPDVKESMNIEKSNSETNIQPSDISSSEDSQKIIDEPNDQGTASIKKNETSELNSPEEDQNIEKTAQELPSSPIESPINTNPTEISEEVVNSSSAELKDHSLQESGEKDTTPSEEKISEIEVSPVDDNTQEEEKTESEEPVSIEEPEEEPLFDPIEFKIEQDLEDLVLPKNPNDFSSITSDRESKDAVVNTEEVETKSSESVAQSDSEPIKDEDKVEKTLEPTESIGQKTEVAHTPENESIVTPIYKSINKNDKSENSGKKTFTQWLNLSQKPSINISEKAKKEKEELINAFLEKNPKISPIRSMESDNVIDINSIVENDQTISHLMTETLAKLYVEQRKYNKAIEAYEILILKNPEKSGIFADQIKKIKNLK